jgi:hypothetical protein
MNASSHISKLLVIDGTTLTQEQILETRRQMQAVLRKRGTVFVWASPENLVTINTLLPKPLAFVAQDATALLADRTAPETAAISLASLYFQDQSDKIIVKNELAGPLVETSRILMESNAISRRRRTPTPSRYPVLIATDTGGGRLLVTSLTPDTRTDRRLQLMRNLFANSGVALRLVSTEPAISTRRWCWVASRVNTIQKT